MMKKGKNSNATGDQGTTVHKSARGPRGVNAFLFLQPL